MNSLPSYLLNELPSFLLALLNSAPIPIAPITEFLLTCLVVTEFNPKRGIALPLSSPTPVFELETSLLASFLTLYSFVFHPDIKGTVNRQAK